MKEEDFAIDVEDGRIVISGVRPEPCTEKRMTYHCLEIPSGPFRREFPLLPDVDPERAEAVYRDGFLTVTLHKIGSRNNSR